jgi:hypothetical protein
VGARPIHDREWGKRLMARGCTRERTRREGGQITVWQGIGLLAEENLCTPCIPKPTFPELSQTEINASRGGIYGKRALGVHSVHSDSYYVNMADELAEGGAE